MSKFTDKLKDVVGLEGTFKETIFPMARYESAHITLGGAGYPIGQFHQQFLAYVEGLDTEQAGRISLISGLWDAFNDPVMGIITDRTKSRFGRRRPWILAGGLGPDNLAEAVRRFRPYAVDLSSGAETEGWKDPKKMARCVQAVRETCSELI